MAFWNAPAVITSRVRVFASSSASTASAVASTSASLDGSRAVGSAASIEGFAAVPGSAIPSASMHDAIVFAVNMPPHAPAPGMAQHSTIAN